MKHFKYRNPMLGFMKFFWLLERSTIELQRVCCTGAPHVRFQSTTSLWDQFPYIIRTNKPASGCNVTSSFHEWFPIKMPVRYILSSVWVRLSMFSELSIIQYMGPCVLTLPIPLAMIEIIYTLSYYHHQIGSINCYPLFSVRSWNNDMRCMSLYSYEFVIWTDCFVGHLCPGGICPEYGPLSPTCSITTMLGTLLMIDT